MAYQLFPLLCGLATVSFTACAHHRGQSSHWLLGFFSVLYVTGAWNVQAQSLLLIDPTHVATVLALAAFAILHKHRWRSAGVVLGGMLAALWINVLSATGYPWLPVTLAVCLVSVLAFVSAIARKGFVSTQLQDEALIIVIAVSLVVSIVPTAISGWQTAASLQSLDISQNETYSAVGVLLLSFACMVVGGIYAKWKHR